MELPDYGFDDFLDDECGVFISGYVDGRYDLRISTADGEIFSCVPEGELLDFMRGFFSGNERTDGLNFF
ncbi:hypothetical protein [Pectobacterium versatile]|uniref:hypothetical protein n=1 Tax=Pectobacterium versatile TaxID=2488639 RepID=UPI00301A76F3